MAQQLLTTTASNNWLQLINRTAIITGASSGIGHATAQFLHNVGCHLVLADVNDHGTELTRDTPLSTQEDIPTIRRIKCDVTKRDDVDAMMSMALNWSNDTLSTSSTSTSSSSTTTITSNVPPPASILINCAGIIRDRRIDYMTENEWDTVLDVNCKGTYLTCQSFLQQRTNHVLCTTPASIINISSIVALSGNYGQVNYAASKGGILGLTMALAKEVARRNVRVNAVVPGFIQTNMSQQVPDHILKTIIEPRIAMQRLGLPIEVANVIAFLASERSSYITGTTIECSGMISL